MREEFDFDAALAALQDGRGLTGNGIQCPNRECCDKAIILACVESWVLYYSSLGVL